MKIKRVVLDPNPILRAPNADVTEPWEEIEENVRKMFKVMYAYRGVGLSAPQVAWNVKLFVMNFDNKTWKPKSERIFWNPEIIEKVGEPVVLREGCLSLPNVFGNLMRYKKIKLKAMSPSGLVEEEFEGYAAQIVQHEVGHMNSDLCFDHYLTPVFGDKK